MRLSAEIRISGPLFAKGPEIVQRYLEAFVEEVVQFLTREIKERTPQGIYGAQGGLLGSIGNTISGRGTQLVRGVIGTPQAYGAIVERGRRPGKMPPKGVLVRWIEVKLGLDARSAQSVEYLIRRKIARKGTKGAAMFSRALMENEAAIARIAERYQLKTVVDLNGK